MQSKGSSRKRSSRVLRGTALRPRKSLGQNFLRDENICRKIVAAIDPQPGDVMLEIGPGEGALTKYLAPRVRKLTVVDIDERVVRKLQVEYPDGSVEIRNEDVLTTDVLRMGNEAGQALRVVGNIPYNITSPILFRILDNRTAIHDATLMVQKEVAARLGARSGTKDYGILSVFCQLLADVRLLFDVSPNAFYPKPGVTSSVVRLDILPAPRFAVDDEAFFRRMVRAVFGKRRKTLKNSLTFFAESEGSVLPVLPNPQERPERLTVEELVGLGNYLRARMLTTVSFPSDPA